jgi:hypothetical protein
LHLAQKGAASALLARLAEGASLNGRATMIRSRRNSDTILAIRVARAVRSASRAESGQRARPRCLGWSLADVKVQHCDQGPSPPRCPNPQRRSRPRASESVRVRPHGARRSLPGAAPRRRGRNLKGPGLPARDRPRLPDRDRLGLTPGASRSQGVEQRRPDVDPSPARVRPRGSRSPALGRRGGVTSRRGTGRAGLGWRGGGGGAVQAGRLRRRDMRGGWRGPVLLWRRV